MTSRGRYPKTKWCFLRDDDRVRTMANIFIERLGITQTELSKATGISQRNISGWCRGVRPYPTQVDIIHLLDYLELQVDIRVTVKEL